MQIPCWCVLKKNKKIIKKGEGNTMTGNRIAEITRKTNETDISLTLRLDGSGKGDIHSGVGFFDHMLSGFTRHGFFDLTLNVTGDLEVDCHHTIEDTGIVLGNAIREALGDKKGIKRFGSMILPMDETLVLCAIDLSGRPYFAFDAAFTTDRVGDMDTEMVREFFYAVSYSAGMNLHMKVLSGTNNHHIIEALFKAFGKALDEASSMDARITDILSTKGSL
jgi:imidazoleglycerol-phosphate dehydratase